ncbi:DNA polymerase alpha/epsilon subunit B-domain-containing protein [Myxozyma melibiosi]|uniref:DNA polymerase epsilon subunit B n=1 Tax=Myxozyma melibiosi TaxID=54550 RepID=A0ABR1F7Y7_9ASCO
MPVQSLHSFASLNSFKKPAAKRTSSSTSSHSSIRSPSPSLIPALPIELQPSQFRPVAFRILSKKHSLNIQTSGLEYLADYVGRKYGRDWRTKCEPLLNDIGRRWKEQDKGQFITAEILPHVLQEIELRNASFVGGGGGSGPNSGLNSPIGEMEMDPLMNFSPQEFFHVWDAFEQPRWYYNRIRKHFEKGSPPSMFPSTKHLVNTLNARYYQLYHKLLRNEEFQAPSFHSSKALDWRAVTIIKNLLGRHGQAFCVLGLLIKGSNGNWWAEDPSGRLELELNNAEFGDGYFVPGCILLFDGVYTRTEKLRVKSIRHPPAETREVSREAYGYLDFMGVGNVGSTPDGRFDKAIEEKMVAEEKRKGKRGKIVVLGGEMHLDDAKTFEALARVFAILEEAPPMAVVLCGSFLSIPFYNNGVSSTYKDNFDQLAQLLSKYPTLAKTSTFIFVPGNNDPWGSTASAGGAMLWPQRGVPEIFSSQVRRVLRKSVWTSNPCRICYYSQEIVICRDDLASRLRRNNVGAQRGKPAADAAVASVVDLEEMEGSQAANMDKMIRTVLNQGHISPWPNYLRPTITEYDHALSLNPLPTSLIVCDSSSQIYTYTYQDCHAMNPSTFISKTRPHEVSWIEYSTANRKSQVNTTTY